MGGVCVWCEREKLGSFLLKKKKKKLWHVAFSINHLYIYKKIVAKQFCDHVITLEYKYNSLMRRALRVA